MEVVNELQRPHTASLDQTAGQKHIDTTGEGVS